jgi:type II secretory ATPase GspE/PulE/Tfp pilus assembly ATPase PilB-like protein
MTDLSPMDPRGCVQCAGTGFRGRVALYEASRRSVASSIGYD